MAGEGEYNIMTKNEVKNKVSVMKMELGFWGCITVNVESFYYCVYIVWASKEEGKRRCMKNKSV